MSDKKRISSKWLSASLYGHFNLWAHSLRTILMAIFILLMNYMLTRSYESGVTMRQWEVHLGETLFAYLDSGFNLTVTSIALLVMMSELPKRVSYQNYTLMRLSRRRWLVSARRRTRLTLLSGRTYGTVRHETRPRGCNHSGW